MGRDHRKLRVFLLADDLVVQVYHFTQHFPDSERYGLRAQLRRSAVSAASNIVEGSARRSTGEYVQFLSISNGSAAEVRYLTDLSHRLGFVSADDCRALIERYSDLMKGLQRLIHSLEPKAESLNQRLKPRA